jgi:hypothetical protein
MKEEVGMKLLQKASNTMAYFKAGFLGFPEAERRIRRHCLPSGSARQSRILR